LLAGIFFSLELWFPVARTFPRVPFIIAIPGDFVLFTERLLTAILVLSLILIPSSIRPKIFSVTAITSLLLLIFFDQMRLQPWVYQYLLLLVILALHDWQKGDKSAEDQTLALLQVMIAGLYFWSGVQKLNFTFTHETLPMLLTPLENLFPSFQPPTGLPGISIALVESLIGGGLLWRKTRNLSVYLAAAMHGVIVSLLIAKQHNSIVWIWNGALMAIVVTAFWKSDVSLHRVFAARQTPGWKLTPAKFLAAASVLLPLLSFFGLWDMYLSGALYSGNTEVPVIRINEAMLEKLPPKAQAAVFQTKSAGEPMLPLFEWAIAELNVPVYPEQRVFNKVAREVCRLTNDKNQVELIVKKRPAIFDGNYRVTRINCAELER
jgi:hypothetical protein